MRTLENQYQPQRFKSVKYRLSRQSAYIRGMATPGTRNTCVQSVQKHLCKRRNDDERKSAYLNLSVARKWTMDSQSPQQQKIKKVTYMETFHYLLNLQRNKYNAKQNIQLDSKQTSIDKLNNAIQSIKLPRVSLPILNQLDSYFTVLDNIHLPIAYISEGIARIRQEMNDEVANMKKIGVELRAIGKKHEKCLTEVEEVAVSQFQRLRSMLRTNKVFQQQQVLKLKSSFEKTRDYLPRYYNELGQSKYRLIKLQQTIFKDLPFELKQVQQFEQLSTGYF